MIIVSDRRSENKSSGFRSHYHVEFQIIYQFLHGINSQMQAVRILQAVGVHGTPDSLVGRTVGGRIS